jgi:nucleoside-diphosphate-sugar epimerase
MKVVAIGGTGLIGSKTVPILRQRGHEVVAASADTGVNSITGESIKEAMAGPALAALGPAALRAQLRRPRRKVAKA